MKRTILLLACQLCITSARRLESSSSQLLVDLLLSPPQAAAFNPSSKVHVAPAGYSTQPFSCQLNGLSNLVSVMDCSSHRFCASRMCKNLVLQETRSSAARRPFAQWRLATALRSVCVFLLAGLFEIGGGWLVWQSVKEGKPWWYAVLGSCTLAAYGFVATLQPNLPSVSFGRVYAVYGGFFILLSYAWGHKMDGLILDRGDKIGAALALAGVLVAWFWPRCRPP